MVWRFLCFTIGMMVVATCFVANKREAERSIVYVQEKKKKKKKKDKKTKTS